MKKSIEFYVPVSNDIEKFRLVEYLLFVRGARWFGDISQIPFTPRVGTEFSYIKFSLSSSDEIILQFSSIKEKYNVLTIDEFTKNNYALQKNTIVELNEKYMAEITDEGIQVGCQFISAENLTTLFNKLKEENVIK